MITVKFEIERDIDLDEVREYVTSKLYDYGAVATMSDLCLEDAINDYIDSEYDDYFGKQEDMEAFAQAIKALIVPFGVQIDIEEIYYS